MEDETLIDLWTTARTAIDTAAERMANAESAESQRAAGRSQARANTAIDTFQAGLKKYYTNKGKFVGATRTPRKGGAAASPAVSNPFAGHSLVQSQETNMLLRGVVEIGRSVSLEYAPRYRFAC
jgi:hypothetical protein